MWKKLNSFFAPSVWALSAFIYIVFIFTFCHLYPLGGDDYWFYPLKWGDITEGYILCYLIIGSRIGILPARFVLFFGKEVFNIVTPVLYLLLVGLSFYAVFLRKPDFKTLKDLPAFLLLMLLAVFAVAQPDNNIFWIGGVSNYSWPFLLLIPFFIAGRFLLKGSDMPLFSKRYAPFFVFLWGFCLGTAGETLGPVSLMFALALIIYLKLVKRTLPKWLKIIIGGMIAGLVFLFTSPGLVWRSSLPSYDYFYELGLFGKIFRHLPFMVKACAANFFLFPISVTILGLCFFKNGIKGKLLEESYFFTVLMLVLSLASASALALAPIANLRPFYPATVLSIIAFMSALDLLRKTFNLDLYRYCFYIVFIFTVVILPLYLPPFITLHNQELMRQKIIKDAVAAQKEEVYLLHFITTKGPYDNLTVYFYDYPIGVRSKYSIVTQPADQHVEGQNYIKQY